MYTREMRKQKARKLFEREKIKHMERIIKALRMQRKKEAKPEMPLRVKLGNNLLKKQLIQDDELRAGLMLVALKGKYPKIKTMIHQALHDKYDSYFLPGDYTS